MFIDDGFVGGDWLKGWWYINFVICDCCKSGDCCNGVDGNVVVIGNCGCFGLCLLVW